MIGGNDISGIAFLTKRSSKLIFVSKGIIKCEVEPSLSPVWLRRHRRLTNQPLRSIGSSPYGTNVPTARHRRFNSTLSLMRLKNDG